MAFTLFVPPSTAPAVPVAGVIATVTMFVADVTALPPASTTTTTTGGAMGASDPTVDGSVMTASANGAPAATAKVVEMALVSPTSGAEATKV